MTKSFPHWLKQECPFCQNKWLEVWAFIDENDKYVCPIGVCPKCGQFYGELEIL